MSKKETSWRTLIWSETFLVVVRHLAEIGKYQPTTMRKVLIHWNIMDFLSCLDVESPLERRVGLL